MLTCGLFSDHGEKATDLFWSFVAEAINESREGVNSWLLLYDYRDIKVDVSDKVKRHAEREVRAMPRRSALTPTHLHHQQLCAVYARAVCWFTDSCSTSLDANLHHIHSSKGSRRISGCSR